MSSGSGSVIVFVIGALAAAGVYLLLERSLSRVAIGVILLGNAVNLLFLVVGGPPGGAPIVGQTPTSEMADPLPQAMILTAIVITLALTGFLLAMAYRSWQINEHDEVQDDLEDRRIARLAAIIADSDPEGADVATLDDDAAEARDETELFVDEHWHAGDEDEDL